MRSTLRDYIMLKRIEIDPNKPTLCVAGAGGRMGAKIIQEARERGMVTVGAVEAMPITRR